MVSRVFYEAARDLDSPPSPRTDRVEACRPRECCPSQSSGDKKTDAAPAPPRPAFEDPRGLAPRLDLRVARPHTHGLALQRLDSASATKPSSVVTSPKTPQW